MSIHSKNEQLFLTKLVFTKYNANNHVWIGARRTSNTTFEWEDNSAFDFVYWASGQPNNLDNKHYCASLLYTPNSAELGKWYDDPCSDRYFALCQRYAENQVEIQEKGHLIDIKNDSFQVQTENSSFGALIDSKSSENQIKKEKGNFAATILSVVVVIEFIIITLLILLLIKRQSILPPYRTLSMSECTRNSLMT